MMELMNLLLEFAAVLLVFGVVTWAWTGQSTSGTDDVVIASGYKLSFFGATFNDPIIVNDTSTSTHVENASKVEQCLTVHMNNLEYLTVSTVSLNGAGSVNLNTLTDANMNLKINFDETSDRETFDGTFTIYGASTGVAPTDITAYACEQGDTNWTGPLAGTATAVALADQVSAASQDFFIGISIEVDSVGEKNTEFTMRVEVTYA